MTFDILNFFKLRGVMLALTGVIAMAVALPASATVLLTTGDTYSTHENLLGRNVLSEVTVGASDVAISGFGTKGTLAANGNVELVIFDGAGSGLSPAYSSGILAANASGDVWWDSPALSFIMLAGHTYQMGLMADQFFSYDWNFGVADITSNGLTALGGTNGNANGDLVNPLTQGGGSVQQAIEIFGGSNVPEPFTLALVGVGLAGLGFSRKKKQC